MKNKKIYSILSILYHHSDFLKKYYKTFGIFYKLRNMFPNISGGGMEQYSIYYKNEQTFYNIKFDKIIDDDIIALHLSTLDNKDSCIFIIIDKDNNFAYIEGITYNKYTTCFDSPKLNNGKTIMEITIKMLKKYKNKLNINSIQLRDNSFILCDTTNICLADLSFLQYNETFYGRFGFRPIDKNINKKYLKNIDILQTTLVKNIDLIKILNNYEDIIDIKIMNKMIHNYTKHKDINIIQWFSKFSKKYFHANCKLMDYLVDTIYKKLELTSMKSESFILKI